MSLLHSLLHHPQDPPIHPKTLENLPLRPETHQVLQHLAQLRGWDLGRLVGALLDEITRLDQPTLMPYHLGFHRLMEDHGLTTLQLAGILHEFGITPADLSDHRRFSEVCSLQLLDFIREHFYINPDHWSGKPTSIAWGARWIQDQYLMSILMDSVALGEHPRVYFLRSPTPHHTPEHQQLVSVVVERQHFLQDRSEKYFTYQGAGSVLWGEGRDQQFLARLAGQLECLHSLCRESKLGYETLPLVVGQEVPYSLDVRYCLGTIHPARLVNQWDSGEWNPAVELHTEMEPEYEQRLRRNLGEHLRHPPKRKARSQ